MPRRARGPRLSRKAFSLLEGLAADNSKEWFHAHKAEFRAEVLEPFGVVLEAVSERLHDADLVLRGGSQTMFRMNRDVRFSPDKRPYRETVAGLLTPSGTKVEADGVAYVEFGLSGGWVGGGFYKLPTKELNVLRDHIVAEPKAWFAAKREVAARGGALVDGDALKGMPRGFQDHADSEVADDLRRKSLLVRGNLTKTSWLDGSVVDRIVKAVGAIAPIVQFGTVAQQRAA